MMKLLSLLLSFFVLLPSIAQSMDITVNGVQRYFISGERPFQEIVVTNKNQTKTFDIGVLVEKFTDIDEYSNKTGAELTKEPVQGEFMLAPKKFRLGPGQKRTVRLIYTKPFGDKESVYAISFKPKVDRSFTDNKDAESIQMGTDLVIAAGLLALVSPFDPDLDLEFERDAKGITFKNTGNIAADLKRRVSYCYKISGDEVCMPLPGKRIYPGNTWRYEVDGDIPLRWAVQGYERYTKWLDIPVYDE